MKMFKRFSELGLAYLENEAKREILKSIIAANNSHKLGWEDRAFELSQVYRNISK